jgi:subtilisin family serine protease
MDGATRKAVEALPFVRSVTPFHPVYKLEDQLVQEIGTGQQGSITVNLLTTRRSGHAPVIEWVEANGGEIVHVSQPTYLMTVTLPYEKLSGLAALNGVKCIDRWSAPENDVDIARSLHGADIIEELGGYDGTGVNGEVLDSGTEVAHPDFGNFVLHNQLGPGSHGTCTAGIIFGNGLGGNPRARGFAPNGRLIAARYLDPYAGGSRYSHSGELVNPALNYQAVFQSNSWGGGRTLAYNSQSSEIDLILFDFDHLTITQSQSNAGNQQSRPQAWGKNVVSVGALNHFGTRTPVDDRWNFGASIGPAADGRIKPDLASFYDRTLATDRLGNLGYAAGNWFENFGGTSGATPITAGCFALFYEMWGDGIFGNSAGGTVFQDAPNNTTAKAFMVNSASAWRFEGPNHDATRTHQGWGRPDVRTLFSTASDYVWVDETDPLTNLQTRTYSVVADPGDRQLRVTMVYRDPAGTTSSTLHRINNIDLKVTSPSGTVFWGNNGMLGSIYTISGGGPSNVDTVENVWAFMPEAGTWTIEVIAAEVNVDTHSETGAVDVDFALVAYSGTGG